MKNLQVGDVFSYDWVGDGIITHCVALYIGATDGENNAMDLIDDGVRRSTTAKIDTNDETSVRNVYVHFHVELSTPNADKLWKGNELVSIIDNAFTHGIDKL